MTKKPFWEDSYKRPGKLDTFGEGKPSADVVAAVTKTSITPGMKALDLGCGEGRNALYLAKSGFITYASDISASGIQKLNSFAKEMNLRIESSVCDMRDYTYQVEYDLIVCQGCLHLIKKEEWQRVIAQMKEHTSQGGYHSVGIFTDTIPEPEDQQGLMVGLFKEGELLTYYKDWEITGSRTYTFEHQHPDGPRHSHSANSIIARKPC
ncbi:methyltransferase domain-containing protein [bacterium]|nr:MAG: methyltransferase domain-containing protein [bacterium]